MGLIFFVRITSSLPGATYAGAGGAHVKYKEQMGAASTYKAKRLVFTCFLVDHVVVTGETRCGGCAYQGPLCLEIAKTVSVLLCVLGQRGKRNGCVPCATYA